MKIQISLAALTRVTFELVLEVPDGTPKHVLDDLVDDMYDESDGSEFRDDISFWDKGDCYWSPVPDEVQIDRVWTPDPDDV